MMDQQSDTDGDGGVIMIVAAMAVGAALWALGMLAFVAVVGW